VVMRGAEGVKLSRAEGVCDGERRVRWRYKRVQGGCDVQVRVCLGFYGRGRREEGFQHGTGWLMANTE